MTRLRRDAAMRARVPITIGGLGVAGLALSAIVGAGGLAIVICCLALLGALAFGRWVLSANDRTARLIEVIQAIRGSGGPATESDGKTIEKHGREN